MGNWVAKHRKEHATDQEKEAAAEAAEITQLVGRSSRAAPEMASSWEKAAAWHAKNDR